MATQHLLRALHASSVMIGPPPVGFAGAIASADFTSQEYVAFGSTVPLSQLFDVTPSGAPREDGAGWEFGDSDYFLWSSTLLGYLQALWPDGFTLYLEFSATDQDFFEKPIIRFYNNADPASATVNLQVNFFDGDSIWSDCAAGPSWYMESPFLSRFGLNRVAMTFGKNNFDGTQEMGISTQTYDIGGTFDSQESELLSAGSGEFLTDLIATPLSVQMFGLPEVPTYWAESSGQHPTAKRMVLYPAQDLGDLGNISRNFGALP